MLSHITLFIFEAPQLPPTTRQTGFFVFIKVVENCGSSSNCGLITIPSSTEQFFYFLCCIWKGNKYFLCKRYTQSVSQSRTKIGFSCFMIFKASNTPLAIFLSSFFLMSHQFHHLKIISCEYFNLLNIFI